VGEWGVGSLFLCSPIRPEIESFVRTAADVYLYDKLRVYAYELISWMHACMDSSKQLTHMLVYLYPLSLSDLT
jgi:hypothetical protein